MKLTKPARARTARSSQLISGCSPDAEHPLKVEDLKRRLGSNANGLERLSASARGRLLADFPLAPLDYVALLSELGWGSVGGRYMIYAGPVPADEVFSGSRSVLRGVVLVGDDFAGTHAAYFISPQGWQFFVLEHTDLALHDYSPAATAAAGSPCTFTEFLIDELTG